MWGEQLGWRVLYKNDPTWDALFPVDLGMDGGFPVNPGAALIYL